MRRLPREVRAAVPGRTLAWAESDRGWLAGTRDALVRVSDPVLVLPWEQVEAADWDADAFRLTVSEVGEFGRQRASYAFVIEAPGRLLELVRERITASIVLQRHVAVRGRTGFRVVARRNPGGGPLRWMHEYDAGVDPADPEVARLADAALRAAREELGDPI